jgi:glucose/arabinose dehydrogenase
MILYRGARIVLPVYTSFAASLLIVITGYHFIAQYAYGQIPQPQSASGPIFSDPDLRAEVVFRGIDFPTSMAFLDDNDILVLEKNEGTVRRIMNGNMLEDPLLRVNVSAIGERGMLGIAIPRDICATSKTYVFLYYTEASQLGESPVRNKLYRYELEDDKLVHPKLILDLQPSSNSIHNGGTVSIGPDCNVYLVVGDMSGDNPQETELPSGRAGILRITQDGMPAEPSILGSTNPLNKYYAYGIRNSFGMDFDPVTGYLWDTENGPEFGDEINLVGPGFNSGWREIQGFWNIEESINEEDKLEILKGDPIPENIDDTLSNFNGSRKYSPPEPTLSLNTTISGLGDILEFGGESYYSHPELATAHSIGLTGPSFLDTTRYGLPYKNDLVVGGFHNGSLYHFELSRERTELDLTGKLGDRIADNEDLKKYILGRGFGGITDIEVGPDGYLYILSLFKGGDNCPSTLSELVNDTRSEEKECINYDSELQGTIFRMVQE